MLFSPPRIARVTEEEAGKERTCGEGDAFLRQALCSLFKDYTHILRGFHAAMTFREGRKEVGTLEELLGRMHGAMEGLCRDREGSC